MTVEQAIFTSVRTSSREGYQLAAWSTGLSEQNQRELSAWGPSHDSMLETGPDALSVNFHSLPSGSYCISQTTPAGMEYSGRGVQVYTQSLIVSPGVLRRFANNPFALLRAAVSQGHLLVHEEVPKRLEAFDLTGRAEVLEEDLVRQTCQEFGAHKLAALLAHVLHTQTLGIAPQEYAPRLIATLINCLPLECRPQVTFSTGLKFSPRRPYRLICLPSDAGNQRRVQKQYGIEVFDLEQDHVPQELIQQGWPALVMEAIESDHLHSLAELLCTNRLGLRERELPALAEEIREQFSGQEQVACAVNAEAATAASLPPSTHVSPADEVSMSYTPDMNDQEFSGPELLDDVPAEVGSHRPPSLDEGSPEFSRIFAVATSVVKRSMQLAETVGSSHPHVRPQLEALNDAVLAMLLGNSQEMELVQHLWSEVAEALDSPTLHECRERYARFVIGAWKDIQTAGQSPDPATSVNVLEIAWRLLEE